MAAQIGQLALQLVDLALLAHVLTEKFCDGLPFHRQEDRLARIGTPLDRGTMCRWAEHLGATVGATVVAAMHANALATATPGASAALSAMSSGRGKVGGTLGAGTGEPP